MNEAVFNEHLKKFDGIHKNESAILFATGPSLNFFKKFDKYKNLIKFGVNKIYNYEYINDLDYYFFGSHYYIEEEHKNKVDNLSKKLNKFSSVYRNGLETGHGNINKIDSDKLNCFHFECGLENFTKNPSQEKLLGHSIVFPAIQMILYMGITEIYLVGCDIVGHDENHLLNWWNEFKIWKEKEYKSIKIFVINPVGLKNMFIDYEQ